MNNLKVIVNGLLNVKYLILFTLFAVNLVDQPAPEVTIDQGTLSGLIRSDGTYFEYLGIPYASINKSARFQAPLPPPSWDGVFRANQDLYTCAQKSSSGMIGSEDCLRMNIYVPAISKGPLPVMFSIHGGAFIVGSGGKALFGPEFLMKLDVILVTFNYRLGPLGFLCLGTKEAPGNAGMKDQVAALRWVKKNIAAFGGDPDNVTVFGESAGGASTSLLLVSDTTNGLFKRAIVQSGSAISHWGMNTEPLESASQLAKKLGYDSKDPSKLADFLNKVPLLDLLKTNPDPFELSFGNPLIYLPCVEKTIPGVEPFLTDLPYNLISKTPKTVPIMFGTTSKEGLFLVKAETESSIRNINNMTLSLNDLKFESDTQQNRESQRVKDFYFNQEIISFKNLMNVSDLAGHLFFEMPMILETEAYLQNTQSDIYNYYFNYSGGRNFLKYHLGYNVSGACHGDDLLYIFKGRIWPFRIHSDDQRIIDYMTQMWTNFAKYGDPTPASAVDLPFKWIPSRKGDVQFLYIDDPMKMGPIPNPEAYHMWKDIYAKYRRKTI